MNRIKKRFPATLYSKELTFLANYTGTYRDSLMRENQKIVFMKLILKKISCQNRQKYVNHQELRVQKPYGRIQII